MKQILLALCIAGAGFAQTNAHEAPVMSILNDIHAVNSLDKTLAFYRAVFGLDAQPRPFPNPGVPALTNSPGVSLRIAVLKFPNASFGFELTEFSGIERKPGRPTHTDPGAGTMVLRVRDLDSVVATAKKAGAEIVPGHRRP
jgi:predicted enzyme related to lactoylglutathione lyase